MQMPKFEKPYGRSFVQLDTHQDDAFARHHFFTSDKFMIFEFVIAADEELKFLERVATGYRIRPTNVICLTGYDRTRPDLARARKQDGEKSNAFPTYAASSWYKTNAYTIIVFLNTS